MAVEAGRMAYEAKLAPKNDRATATSPMLSFLNDIKSL
jgi:thiazole synthase